MGSFQEFHCDWKDRRNSDSRIDEIRIQLFNESKSAKYLTIHIYLTTFWLTFQSLNYLTWASEEFDYMKSIVDAQDPTTELNDTLSPLGKNPFEVSQNITNYEEFFTSLANGNSQTDL